MRFKWIAAGVPIGATITALSVSYELSFGGKVVVASKPAGVFDVEYAVAYAGAINRVPSLRIASIESGEHVAVLWDPYGRDYWACYVRTFRGVGGGRYAHLQEWVLNNMDAALRAPRTAQARQLLIHYRPFAAIRALG